MRRREALTLLGAVGISASTARAVDNVLLGYGAVSGTNLHEQDLIPLLTANIRPRRWRYAGAGGQLALDGGTLTVTGPDGETALDPWDTSRGTARDADELHDLPDGPVTEIVADLGAIDAGDTRYTFHDPASFFDRVTTARARPYTIDLLRGSGVRSVKPATVREFTGADPASTRAIVKDLVEGFRRHAHYDVPRYTAGAIKYNVLFGAYDPRDHFEAPVDFKSLLEADEETGMFCNEFTDRSLEALHAVPAPNQSAPVIGLSVADWRHKHVYTGITSVLRRPGGDGDETDLGAGAGAGQGDLEVATTFVDYTHTTLYDDFHATGLLGEGLDAYNRRHRADGIFWVRG